MILPTQHNFLKLKVGILEPSQAVYARPVSQVTLNKESFLQFLAPKTKRGKEKAFSEANIYHMEK